jgi:hypothetical protein
MDLAQDELKRAVRTATRSLEAAKIAAASGDTADRHIARAVHQLAFVLERLLDERAAALV